VTRGFQALASNATAIQAALARSDFTSTKTTTASSGEDAVVNAGGFTFGEGFALALLAFRRRAPNGLDALPRGYTQSALVQLNVQQISSVMVGGQ
jgi:hypothetical protein